MMKRSFYTIYKNVIEYLDSNGYDTKSVSKNGEKEITDMINSQPYIKISSKKNNMPNNVFIIIEDTFISKSLMFSKLLDSIKEKETILTIISENGIKVSVQKFLSKYSKKKIHLKDLKHVNFKVDPRKHILVPKHRICSPSETKKIMDEESINDIRLFPKIKLNDIQVIWLDGQVGQLVKIDSISPRGRYIYYRLIIQ